MTLSAVEVMPRPTPIRIARFATRFGAVQDPAGDVRNPQRLPVVESPDHHDHRSDEQNGRVGAAGAERPEGRRRQIEGQQREHRRLDGEKHRLKSDWKSESGSRGRR